MTKIGRALYHPDHRIQQAFDDIYLLLQHQKLDSSNMNVRDVAAAVAGDIREGELAVLDAILARIEDLEARVTALETP